VLCTMPSGIWQSVGTLADMAKRLPLGTTP